MTDNERALDALVAFIKALAIPIMALDNPGMGEWSSRKFLYILDEVIGELSTLPEGQELIKHVEILRESLDNFLGKSKDIERLARMVNEVYDHGDS